MKKPNLKSTLLFLFLYLAIISLFYSCKSENLNSKNIGYTVIDDLNNKIYFEDTPKKIITLAPNLTEMIFNLGLQNYLAGNTLYCNYPEEAEKIEKVGDLLTFNFEKIIKLKPDLIFITVEGNTKETYEKFKELGLKIFVSNPRNFSGVKKTFSDISRIFRVEEKANKILNEWNLVIDNIKRGKDSLINKTALFLIELKPIMLAGKNTFLNEYLEFNGLKNIADDVDLNYPVFNREEILRRDPDFIIYPTGEDITIKKIISVYPEWKFLKAIKNKNVIFIDRDLYMRPGSRFVEALVDLNSRLHQHQNLH
jgi:iron complex transport system substrate-binding protein